MFIKPLMDRVLIEPVDVEQKSGGGIVLTGENTKVTYLHGIVVAKGPGKQKASGEYVPIPLEIGQTVVYGNVSSTLEDMIDGKKVFLVEQNAIVGILEDQPVNTLKEIDLDYASRSAHIGEHMVAAEPLQEVYRGDDILNNIVPSTSSSSDE